VGKSGSSRQLSKNTSVLETTIDSFYRMLLGAMTELLD
jgi:hypothetical protein